MSSPTNRFQSLLRSIWAFPLAITILLLILTGLKLSGSSIGIYHSLFFGETEDSSLFFNQPQSIRSDEWLVNTQMAMAQESNDFNRINEDIGNGQDVSALVDAPYVEWSSVFRPQNLSFLILPFEYAFAFKWWFLSYMLVLACYFFIVTLMPQRKILAIFLSLGFLFSPFVQWWYLVSTIGLLAYSLFGATVFIKIIRQKSLMKASLWGVLLAYIVSCFALVLYPPFQIPCLLVLVAFGVGFLMESFRKNSRKYVLQRIGVLAASIAIAGLITGIFIYTRQDVIHSLTNTAYPGKRIVTSGGYDKTHFASSHLSAQFQNETRAKSYSAANPGISNQSEASNFILLTPFLFVPSIILLMHGYRTKKKIDWPLLTITLLFLLFLVRMFLPVFDIPFKLLQLDKVPHARLLIGIGLLNIVQVVLLIRNLSTLKRFPTKQYLLYLYIGLVVIFELAISYYAQENYPGFIGSARVLLLSIPIPVIVYLLLTKRFVLAAFGFFAFSLFSSAGVNPLYRGTAILDESPLFNEVVAIAEKEEGRWITEGLAFENITLAAGAPSLSGVYAYPQLDIWKTLDPKLDEGLYNRYAHVTFSIDRDTSVSSASRLELPSPDSFIVFTEPCGEFLKQHNVKFILTENRLVEQDSCVYLKRTIPYPLRTFYIYEIRR